MKRSPKPDVAAAETETNHTSERQPLAVAPVTAAINLEDLGENAQLKIACYVMHVRGGASYRDISRTYQISSRTAFNYVREVLAHHNKVATHTLEEARQISLERLDIALLAVLPQVKAGNLFAVDRLLAIEKRRAEIVGFDAAKRLEVTPKGEGTSSPAVSVSIRERWTPAEAAERTGEIIRRLQVAQRESARLAQEATPTQAQAARN
jgi:hypothetical protein